MSNATNEQWLESAQENFEEAVQGENWDLALAIIDDVRDLDPAAATVLERELFRIQNIPHAEIGEDGMIHTV